MNLSLQTTGGGLLLVPQFTLAADTRKGTRAGIQHRGRPRGGAASSSAICSSRRGARIRPVAAGEFGAHMQVELVNDGPVTFWLET